MIAARLSPVCDRSGATRFAAEALPVSRIFYRPMRSTSSLISVWRSYDIVT